jgi:hypothetical protein
MVSHQKARHHTVLFSLRPVESVQQDLRVLSSLGKVLSAAKAGWSSVICTDITSDLSHRAVSEAPETPCCSRKAGKLGLNTNVHWADRHLDDTTFLLSGECAEFVFHRSLRFTLENASDDAIVVVTLLLLRQGTFCAGEASPLLAGYQCTTHGRTTSSLFLIFL